MNILFPTKTDLHEQIQSRLMHLAALFLFLFSIILTLSPAVKMRSWDVEYRWVHWIGFLIWLSGSVFIYRKSLKFVPESDPYLLPLAMLLSGWGILTIFRLDSYFGLRQSVWFLAALAVFYIFLRIPDFLQLLQRYKYILLISGLALMALTLIIGIYPGGNGPQLWLKIGLIYIQPSEPIKLLLVIYLAAYLSDKLPMQLSMLKLITPTLIIIGVAAGILLVQRDLGTVSIIILLYFLVTYLVSGKKDILIIGAVSLVLAAIVGYMVFPVIQIRVDSWINPWLNPSGNSYQIVQSLLATASGGVFGRGIGIGNPGVVPIAHSDFYFRCHFRRNGVNRDPWLDLAAVFIGLQGYQYRIKSPQQLSEVPVQRHYNVFNPAKHPDHWREHPHAAAYRSDITFCFLRRLFSGHLNTINSDPVPYQQSI